MFYTSIPMICPISLLPPHWFLSSLGIKVGSSSDTVEGELSLKIVAVRPADAPGRGQQILSVSQAGCLEVKSSKAIPAMTWSLKGLQSARLEQVEVVLHCGQQNLPPSQDWRLLILRPLLWLLAKKINLSLFIGSDKQISRGQNNMNILNNPRLTM